MMAVKRIDVERWALEQRKLSEEFIPAARRGALSAAHRIQALMVKRTRQAPSANPSGKGTGGAVNTGEYLRAWKAEKTAKGARTFNDRPYAPVVEHGRRIGKPPPSKKIAEWARRRLGLSEKEARSAAFLIARAIGRRGLKGRKILTGAEAEIERFTMEEIDRELTAAIRKR